MFQNLQYKTKYQLDFEIFIYIPLYNLFILTIKFSNSVKMYTDEDNETRTVGFNFQAFSNSTIPAYKINSDNPFLMSFVVYTTE